MSALIRRCPRCRSTGQLAPKTTRARIALPFAKPERLATSKARKQKEHRENISTIRRRVMLRARGCCEVSGCSRIGISLDHWLGGSGRRREAQAFGNCWLLCAEHDRARTHNLPNAAWWNSEFEKHCAKYGFSFYPHLEKDIAGARQ